DTLLAMMDEGMVLHASGQLEQSIQVLAQADKLSERLDFTSVSEEARFSSRASGSGRTAGKTSRS
ncbi:MAG: hypothetical protein ACXWLA_00375, partial [Myxococcaceae bacterium]